MSRLNCINLNIRYIFDTLQFWGYFPCSLIFEFCQGCSIFQKQLQYTQYLQFIYSMYYTFLFDLKMIEIEQMRLQFCFVTGSHFFNQKTLPPSLFSLKIIFTNLAPKQSQNLSLSLCLKVLIVQHNCSDFSLQTSSTLQPYKSRGA